jgi:hypothetical protein
MEREVFKIHLMPFGLGPAPGVFTKLLKPIVSFLRQRGVRLVIYLDDILIIGHSKESAEEAVCQVFHLFVSLGFVIHEEKSIMVPTQSLEYIGLGIDTISMTFSLPSKKLDKLKEMCSLAYKSSSPSLQDLVSLLGILNWAAHSVIYAPAHCRNRQAFYTKHSKSAKGDLSARFPLSQKARSDLDWWMSKASFSARRKLTASPPQFLYARTPPFPDGELSVLT